MTRVVVIKMINSGKDPDAGAAGESDFNPPEPVALDHVTSSKERGDDFEKPGPVVRDHIIKHGVPDDPNEERGA